MKRISILLGLGLAGAISASVSTSAIAQNTPPAPEVANPVAQEPVDVNATTLAKKSAQKKAPATAPDPLPPFHAPLELTGTFASKGQNAPNKGNVISPIEAPRPLRIAIYTGEGAPAGSVSSIEKRALMLKGATVTRIKAADFATADLSQYDIVAFSGGMSGAQSRGLGEQGRENVRKYVANGGSYLGICAGAYLATSTYKTSLGLLNGKVAVPDKWRRGAAFLELELSDHGRNIFGDTRDKFFVRYHNGPIIVPANKPDLPAYNVETYFRTEVDFYKAPVGIQVNSPAVITSKYGKGKVLTISPHPENTKGLENFVPRALVWLGEKEK